MCIYRSAARARIHSLHSLPLECSLRQRRTDQRVAVQAAEELLGRLVLADLYGSRRQEL